MSHPIQADVSVPPVRCLLQVRLHVPATTGESQPVTVGVPLTVGQLRAGQPVHLRLGPEPQRCLEVESRALATWHDGSIQWLLLNFLAPGLEAGEHIWNLCTGEASQHDSHAGPFSALTLGQDERFFLVHTGTARFHINRSILVPIEQVELEDQTVLESRACRMVLKDAQDYPAPPLVYHSEVEHHGPLTLQLRLEGGFTGEAPCRFVARLTFWRDTGIVKVSFCLHNPRRAKHPGGQWDLGDEGSIRFRQLLLELKLKPSLYSVMEWQPERERDFIPATGAISLYQDSSGGEQWDSRNHVNAIGQRPQQFQGYRVTVEGADGQPPRQFSGLRASPVVRMNHHGMQLGVAVPEFWQQFPKSLEARSDEVQVGLFPRQWGDLFELQGGERKTHTVWLSFRAPSQEAVALSWVHQPIVASAMPEGVAKAGVLPYLRPSTAPESPSEPAAPPPMQPADDWLAALLLPVVEGPQNYFERREVIDEYGWRNFGDVWADHEALHYAGPPPVISHFNNQYDLLQGLLLNQLRTGDPRWWQLADPLARHVMDIDIYHTKQDKAAYNGGLFWHTDHYLDASTCTHRTFSRNNANGRKGYGGGPGAQHNATSGLRLYYYLTGDPAARDAVLELADWIRAMDDGERNILGVIAEGPTGWATSTFDFFGAGRGAGYSLLSQLDAWLLTGQRPYLEKAEALIRRTVHPNDDVAALELLNAEPRWSYTLFLAALARYLEVKADHHQLDTAYAYGQSALVRYATWMLNHEYPYFDRKETLIYPTETWMGQEIRKANVLRMAARHVDEPLRTQLLARGEALANRAWQDLFSFESRTVCRSIAIWSQEGPKDQWFRHHSPEPLPRSPEKVDFGTPQTFVPQRQQIRQALTSPPQAAQMLLKAADPRRWRRVLKQIEGSLKP